MDRRTFLAGAATGGLTVSAGCTDAMPELLPFDSDEEAGNGEEDSPDEPEGTDPTLHRMAAVTEWSEPGDLDANRTGTIAQADGRFAIAFECEMEPRDGEIVLLADVSLNHGNKGQQDARQAGTTLAVGTTDPQTVEWALGFDAGRIEAGEYLAEATVRDEHTGRKSNADIVTFTVE